jgi:hypothetical protein
MQVHSEVLPDAHTVASDFAADTSQPTSVIKLMICSNRVQTVRSNEQMMQSMKGATSMCVCKPTATMSNTSQHSSAA